ncbi:PDZ domain-containing protein [Persicimonas caeni]|uniref:PDZ domain-containing protein n=1 Tax=Persicimonas caeni TaxID=2292766 RepID=A0A4Y6PU90_PERCE|nr:MXAN_5808 family serine peptidase [Persicimonas caeni]QDG51868.1 PDZ domain-containing protein [Persicimonas caeni]QED33089.1 PDZ domain-containing protein [Persicimonas caeni]
MEKLMGNLKRHGRFIVAFLSLAIAFVLSVQFSDRGVQFDLKNSEVSASEGKDGEYDLSALKILNRVLLRIKDNYVEPERVDPNKMLIAALDEVQNSITELVVTFVGGKENPSAIKVHVNGSTKSFKVKELESLWEMSFRLQKMFRFVEEHLQEDPDLDFREIEYAAINGMLTTLDPHSTLLPPRHYEEMQTQTGGKFGGLGIVISIRDGELTVMSPIPDTPAAKQGIKAKDKIVRIGEESTINMNLNEAVSMMRGEPGTAVDIWIKRKAWSEPRKFTVTRAIINIESVDSQALGDKVGYIRIKNFQANTHSDLVKHLKKLKKKMGGMQGLVLDLRDNPGGLLDQAIKVSDAFLDQGAIVSTVGVGNKMRDKKVATKSGTEPKYPIVVLVNAGSASASEIVSGALQNHDRALVVGDTTFGKGSVQVLYEFNDNSALKLTVAQYLTPGDISIQGKGIAPDLRLVPVALADGEADMFLSNNILRESDLESHLSNAAAHAAGDGVGFVRFLEDVPADGEEEEFEDPNAFKEDFEIKFGQQLVAAVGKTWKRQALLEKLQPELGKISEREMKEIQKKLSTLDVDWSEGENPETANVDLEVTTSVDKDTVKAGEKVKITAKATNKGKKTLHRLKAISSSDNPVLDDKEFLFGKLAPGASKEWTVEVELPKDAMSRHDLLEFQVSGPEDKFGDTVKKPLRIVGLDRPQFAFAYEVVDASGDGVLQKDEKVTFRTIVKNVGQADSNETMVYLKNLAGEAVYLDKGRVKIDKIEKGTEEVAEFEFHLKEIPENDYIELEIDVFDNVFRDFVHKKIKVPFAASKDKVADAKGVAKVKSGPAKLFLGATTKADVAAMADKDATLPVVGKLDDWVKVDLGRRKAWIQKSLVDYDSGATAELSGVTRRNNFQSPQVELNPSTMMTSKDSVSLEAVVEDDSSIKDYYIFVVNRQDATSINTRKLEYTKVDGQKAEIASKIPLFKGMNRVSIIARDEDGMQTSQDTYIYRN